MRGGVVVFMVADRRVISSCGLKGDDCGLKGDGCGLKGDFFLCFLLYGF